MKLRHISIIAALAALALAACSQSDPLPVDGDSDGRVPVDVRLSRAVDNPQPDGRRSYRVIIMTDDGNVFTTGTYNSPEPDPLTGLRDGLLIPWETDFVGNLVGSERNIYKGLYIGHHSSYRVAIVSPARLMKYRNNFFWQESSLRVWGYYIDRYAKYKPSQIAVEDYTADNDTTVPLYVSPPIDINLHPSIADFKDGVQHHILDFGDRYDQMLVERRSAFRLVVDADPLLGSAQITKIGMTNFVDKAFLYLFTGMYIDEHRSSDELILFDAGDTPVTVTDVNVVNAPDAAHREHDVASGDYTYLLSHDYSVKDQYGVYTEEGPTVVVHLADEDGNDIKAKVNLQYNFEPHHEYTFRFTIASRYLVVTAIASPWETDADDNGDTRFEVPIGEPITFPLGGWTLHPGINTEI